MTKQEFKDNRRLLSNVNLVPFTRMGEALQLLFRSAPKDQTQILTADGDDWCGKDSDDFYGGWIYRINPNWTGPAEPTPTPPTVEFVDVKPYIDGDGDWMVRTPHSVRTPTTYLHKMVVSEECIGFVYSGTIHDRLHTTPVSNNGQLIGFKLRIPDFVRFSI